MARLTDSLNQARILCAQFWNPIGVPMANVTTAQELGFPPLPADEYDRYLLHLLALLRSGAPDRALETYLETVERDYLGLTAPAGNKSTFLAALRELPAISGR